MTGRGRPLRFLGVVLSGWIGLRVFLLWPALDTPPGMIRAILPRRLVASRRPHAARPLVRSLAHGHGPSGPPPVAAPMAPDGRHAPDPAGARFAPLSKLRSVDPGRPNPLVAILPGLPRAVLREPPTAAKTQVPSRLSGSAWLVARGGAGIAPGGVGGQLGGSQAGARLAYLVDRRHLITIAARVATPLGHGPREAAIGVEWQPTRVPVRLVAEQRFALDGGRGGPGLALVGGIGPVDVTHGFRLEAYAQAGAIRRSGTELYADGAVRIAHPLGMVGEMAFDLGAGAWGGAQRGAGRLDLGPSLGVSLPLGKQRVRVMLDWRQRVAGAARPGSGAALTLGSDF